MGDEIAFYILSQDPADGGAEQACVYSPPDAGVQRTCVQAHIIRIAAGGHHIGGQIAFIETAFYAQGNDGECGCLAKEGEGEEQKA
jgi:hypothetical protein